jgi:CHAT domain-containing protein/Tfp pilus assembly protein PilF
MLGTSMHGQALHSSSVSSARKVEPQLLPGVVVEKVGKNTEAEKAGLREGDVLLSWSRAAAHGVIDTPADLVWVQIEQSPRGTVELQGTRAGEPRSWMIRVDSWGLECRLNLSPSLLSEHLKAKDLLRAGKANEAYEQWRITARHLPELSSARSWLLYYAGYSLDQASQWAQADSALHEALESASGPPILESFIYFGLAFSASHQNDLVKALRLCDQAVHYVEQPDVTTLTAAFIPQACLGIAVDGGDLASADRYANMARPIWEKVAPNSYGSLANLITLGSLAVERGNIAVGQRYYQEAFMRRTQSTSPMLLAASFWGLGKISRLRGDYSSAERYYRKGMSIYEHLHPKPVEAAELLQCLAFLAQERGDFFTADKYLNRALGFQTKPRIRGGIISDLGELRERQGDLENAKKYLQQAWEIRSKVASGSLALASTLMDLGDVARDTGDLVIAEEHYRAALAIREKNAPGSTDHADALACVASVMRRKQQVEDAAVLYEKALDALENQTARLGGDNDVRSGFRAQHSSIYSDYIDLLVLQNDVPRAFAVAERLRARTLLEMLSTAHVDLHNGVEPTVLDREHSLLSQITAKSDRRIRLLSEAHDQKQDKEVEKEIASLLMQYHDLEAQIRATSPAYAALTQPQPLTAKEVQSQLLDENTLLLEYSLGEERSYVFAVTMDSLQSFELPKKSVLEKASRRVYRLLTARNTTLKGETETQKQSRIARAEAQYPQAAAELSKMLLGPVASQLQNKRLLIVTDGALAYIPFSVLPESRNTNAADFSSATSATATSSTAVPLIVNHEIVNLPSASVLAVLRQQELGRKPAPKAVAVLADPVFDRHDSRLSASLAAASMRGISQTRSARTPSFTDRLLDPPSSIGLLTRSATDVGLSRNGAISLPRLRFSRREADEIMAVTPQGEGKEAVDFEASRATATSPELSQYRIIHLATHGLLDSVHPELSGLVFSMVDKNGRPQNGFLELQDIYNLNLPADLVVLSACETGLGKEISGEGLVGLTRGFMYAGASRVMASLWKVSDSGTAALMGNFYAAMEKDGLPPAAALRAAQIKMWQQKRWRDPYYWAAFQLQGEWK